MIKKSTRGSEWRKWDMHLHSYFTYLNNNFSDISKEEYIEKIVDLNHTISKDFFTINVAYDKIITL